MEILSKVETGNGSTYVLVKLSDDFYAHGVEADINDRYGFPVDSCGTKEEVLNHCISISELCKKHIRKYKKEMIKDNNTGWNILIESSTQELKALQKFIKLLS